MGIIFNRKKNSQRNDLFLIKKMLDNINFTNVIEKCNDFPPAGAIKGFDYKIIIQAFIICIFCGGNNFSHAQVMRHDLSLLKIFGWDKLPSKEGYLRYFNKFNQNLNYKIGDYFYNWFIKFFDIDNLTLDFHSSGITRYGTFIQGTKKSLKSFKNRNLTFHPITAFVNDNQFVANMRLLSDDTTNDNYFHAFFEDTLNKLENKKINLIRLDSGFFQDSILEILETENKTINYIISAKFTHPIQKLLNDKVKLSFLEEGIEIYDMQYQSISWKKSRRLIILRQKIEEKPKKTGQMFPLFPEEEVYRNNRYSAYVTNLNYTPEEIYKMYKVRVNAEKNINELNYDFGFKAFNLKTIYPTEATLTFVMIAYNLFSIFKNKFLSEKVQKKLTI